MTLSDKKSKRKKIIKQKNISMVLSQPWAKKMLLPYEFGEEGKKVLSFTEFKDILKTSNKVVSNHLKELCDIGFLRHVKKGEGYVYSKQFPLCYIFKYEDLRLIHDSPVESIYSITMPYKETKEGMVSVRHLSIYGLKKSNPGLDDIIVPLLKKLHQYINSMYDEELQIIVNDECRKIKNEHVVELIRKWQSKLVKNKLLHPLRIRDEIEPVKIQFDVPEEHREEFKEIIERLWSKFYKECPPIGIVLRF